MSEKSRRLHREVSAIVFSGLIINYPLQLGILYLLLEIWGFSDPFYIATLSTIFMTFFAYTRVYIVRRWFSGKE